MTTLALTSESKLTDRYQTTIPDTVRKALHLHKQDKIRYTIQADGSVLLSRADEVENDPILEPFLSFLAKDLHENPHRVSALSNDFVGQVQSLIADVEIDLDSPLSDEDE